MYISRVCELAISTARQLLVDYYESVEKTLPAMLLPDHTLINRAGEEAGVEVGVGTKFRSLWLMDENFHFSVTTRIFFPVIVFLFFFV